MVCRAARFEIGLLLFCEARNSVRLCCRKVVTTFVYAGKVVNERRDTMNFELSGPAFIGLMVRDVKASAEFYEKTLGFRRDPDDFGTNGGAVAFLSYPIPFAVVPAPPG